MVIPDMNTDTLASLIVVPDQTSKLFPPKITTTGKTAFTPILQDLSEKCNKLI